MSMWEAMKQRQREQNEKIKAVWTEKRTTPPPPQFLQRAQEGPKNTRREFLVLGDPLYDTGRVRAHLERLLTGEGYPYGKRQELMGGTGVNTVVMLKIDEGVKAWGTAVWIALCLVTAGAALAIWIPWILFLRGSWLPTVTVSSSLDEKPGYSRVAVMVTKGEWRHVAEDSKQAYSTPVEHFLQAELGAVPVAGEKGGIDTNG
jgi:hypothetical protein